MFATDTNEFIHDTDIQTVQNDLMMKIECINEWVEANQLSFNALKNVKIASFIPGREESDIPTTSACK